MKIFVAVPTHDRRIMAETVRSLLNEQAAASLCGHELHFGFIPGGSLITHARNQCAAEFLATDCDCMMFVDSDVAWEPGAILKLATSGEEFVGGAYRYKADEEDYPVAWIPKPEIWSDANGFIEVKALPGGFLCLQRSVFEKLKAHWPEREYHFYGTTYHAFFHCPPGNGEDGAFCVDWGTIGGKVWLDPSLTLSHCEGGKKYTGHIGNWLRSRT